MKIALTLNDFPVERLAALAAFLAGSTAAIALSPAPASEEDESGDTPAAQPGQLDANGLPWDARIHSTPAKLTGKNLWRAKRGVSPAETTTVEAELRARVAAGGMQTQAPAFVPPTAPPQPAATIFPPNAGYPAVPGNVQHNPPIPAGAIDPGAQPPVYAPPAPQQPQPPAPGAPIDYPTFMQKIQGLLQMRDANNAALVDAAYLANVSARVGAAFNIQLAAITDLQHNPAALQYAVQVMASEGRWF